MLLQLQFQEYHINGVIKNKLKFLLSYYYKGNNGTELYSQLPIQNLHKKQLTQQSQEQDQLHQQLSQNILQQPARRAVHCDDRITSYLSIYCHSIAKYFQLPVCSFCCQNSTELLRRSMETQKVELSTIRPLTTEILKCYHQNNTSKTDVTRFMVLSISSTLKISSLLHILDKFSS